MVVTPLILYIIPLHYSQILKRRSSQSQSLLSLNAVSELVLWEPLEHFHFRHGGLKMRPVLGWGFGDQVRERIQQSWLRIGGL